MLVYWGSVTKACHAESIGTTQQTVSMEEPAYNPLFVNESLRNSKACAK